MKKIIYIEDEQQPRDTYSRLIRRMLDNEFQIVAPEPSPTIAEMLTSLSEYTDVVSYVIDERLTHTGVANYTGSKLIEELRNGDSKVPIYILTSFADVDPDLGDIEFIIDKNQISNSDFREKISSRIKRHINVYSDILGERNSRLDFLLKKMLNEGLTDDEQAEFDELNFARSKPILLEEQTSAESLKKELDEQEVLLSEINRKLSDMEG